MKNHDSRGSSWVAGFLAVVMAFSSLIPPYGWAQQQRPQLRVQARPQQRPQGSGAPLSDVREVNDPHAPERRLARYLTSRSEYLLMLFSGCSDWNEPAAITALRSEMIQAQRVFKNQCLWYVPESELTQLRAFISRSVAAAEPRRCKSLKNLSRPHEAPRSCHRGATQSSDDSSEGGRNVFIAERLQNNPQIEVILDLNEGFDPTRWPDIKSAVQEKLKKGPSLEFVYTYTAQERSDIPLLYVNQFPRVDTLDSLGHNPLGRRLVDPFTTAQWTLTHQEINKISYTRAQVLLLDLSPELAVDGPIIQSIEQNLQRVEGMFPLRFSKLAPALLVDFSVIWLLATVGAGAGALRESLQKADWYKELIKGVRGAAGAVGRFPGRIYGRYVRRLIPQSLSGGYQSVMGRVFRALGGQEPAAPEVTLMDNAVEIDPHRLEDEGSNAVEQLNHAVREQPAEATVAAAVSDVAEAAAHGHPGAAVESAAEAVTGAAREEAAAVATNPVRTWKARVVALMGLSALWFLVHPALGVNWAARRVNDSLAKRVLNPRVQTVERLTIGLDEAISCFENRARCFQIGAYSGFMDLSMSAAQQALDQARGSTPSLTQALSEPGRMDRINTYLSQASQGNLNEAAVRLADEPEENETSETITRALAENPLSQLRAHLDQWGSSGGVVGMDSHRFDLWIESLEALNRPQSAFSFTEVYRGTASLGFRVMTGRSTLGSTGMGRRTLILPARRRAPQRGQ